MSGDFYNTAAMHSLYSYNGPHCNANSVSNNGALNGLYLMGRHDAGAEWGVRYNGNPGFTPSQLAFLGCPSIYDYTNPYAGLEIEPHGTQLPAAGAGQYDCSGITSQFKYDRNYLYGDLHGAYNHSNGRAPVQ